MVFIYFHTFLCRRFSRSLPNWHLISPSITSIFFFYIILAILSATKIRGFKITLGVSFDSRARFPFLHSILAINREQRETNEKIKTSYGAKTRTRDPRIRRRTRFLLHGKKGTPLCDGCIREAKLPRLLKNLSAQLSSGSITKKHVIKSTGRNLPLYKQRCQSFQKEKKRRFGLYKAPFG